MRCDRAGTILLGGWLLIFPPPLTKDSSGQTVPYREGERAPLTEWSQVSAHATAKECEAAKDRYTESAQSELRAMTKARDYHGQKDDPLLTATVTAHSVAKCVPAESVSPPKP